MERFKYIERQRAKALKVFENARDNLLSVIQSYNREISNSQVMINECHGKIAEHSKGIDYAQEEINKASMTVQKIDNLLE